MRKSLLALYTLLIYAFLFGTSSHLSAQPANGHDVTFTLVDRATGDPLAFASCFLKSTDTKKEVGAATNDKGRCVFSNLTPGLYDFRIICWGQELRLRAIQITPAMTSYTARVNIAPLMIREVTVTAQESKGLSSASTIGKSAINHIQPSSIADVLELIPGGKASDPSFGGPQIIHLREAYNSVGGNYATNSLGTQFMIDGVPINTDANMQHSPNFTTTGYSMGFVNRGVDMRSISTDNIESIEIVRGIPSVEYGDLTSGLIQIKRKRGGRDFEARIKSDMTSKLVSASKGFEWGGDDKLTMNVGVDWLDSRSDPRNIRQNYQRATAQFRIYKTWNRRPKYRYTLGGSMEYTGSFDNEKSDKDLDMSLGERKGPIETYRSNYNRMFFKTDFTMSAKEDGFFHRLDFSASVTSEWDRIARWRYVPASSRLTPLLSMKHDGEFNAELTSGDFDATYDVFGKPFYGYAKLMATFEARGENSSHLLKTGLNWSMSKNYGRGDVFDPRHPFSLDMDLRSRPFSAIPASHQGALFVEDLSRVKVGRLDLEWMLGIRLSTMFNLGSRYSLNGKIYADPRSNLRVGLPSITMGTHELRIKIGGGVGWHTKMPTLTQLFPEPGYIDLVQYNSVGHNDPLRNLVNIRTYTIDPTNYGLKAARNFKWEVRTDFELEGNTLSVTYFREKMKDGFRTTTQFDVFDYKDYAEQNTYYAPDGTPALSATPYTLRQEIRTFGSYGNGSRTRKEGVEFTLTTARLKALRTRLIINGAYFKTTYDNSIQVYEHPSVNFGGRPLPYIGLYNDDDGYIRTSCNTNFTTDTQIPRLGLVFTTSFQCMWFNGSKTMYVDPRPVAYAGFDKVWHPFTDASAQDPALRELIRTGGSTERFTYTEEPFYMLVNLKISKRIFRDKILLSIFTNKLFSYTPPYYASTNADGSNGVLRRRYANAYFGMELNFKL